MLLEARVLTAEQETYKHGMGVHEKNLLGINWNWK